MPPPRPGKAVDERAYPVEVFEQLYAKIRSVPVRDTIRLRAMTGLHHTEIDRLAKGEGKIRVLEGHGPTKGTARFDHKSGRVHTVSVDAPTLAALLRLRERGKAPTESLILKRLRVAAKRVEEETGEPFESILPGRLRHSFATWAVTCGKLVAPKEGGIPLSAVSQAMGHASTSTTSKHYQGKIVPPLVKLPVRLRHVDDKPLKTERPAP